jgi:hypothetical protein
MHLVVRTPPNVSVSELMGVLKGRTAIRLFNKFPHLRKKKLWGNHFLAAWIFCGFGGSERGNNHTICKTSRQSGSRRRGAANDVGYGVTLN